MKSIDEVLDYLRALPKGSIVLLNVDAEDYLKVNIEVLRMLANEEKMPGVYITVNKPYETMKRVLEGEGIELERMYFIDCITMNASGEAPAKKEGVAYIDSPHNLTGISVAMGEAMRAIPDEKRFLFMDSLSTLLLYHNAGTVAKFSHFLTSRMRLWKLSGVLMAVEKETEPSFTAQLSQFCDKVVTLDKKDNG